MFRNNNPDKGTETAHRYGYSIALYLFRNNNPDKGTETMLPLAVQYFIARLEIITPIRGRKPVIKIVSLPYSSFRNNNPDKGTETMTLIGAIANTIRLEIITPIRGRKLISASPTSIFLSV